MVNGTNYVLCPDLWQIDWSCEMSNHATMAVELLVALIVGAILAISLYFYFYKREEDARSEIDDLIEKQSAIILDDRNRKERQLIKLEEILKDIWSTMKGIKNRSVHIEKNSDSFNQLHLNQYYELLDKQIFSLKTQILISTEALPLIQISEQELLEIVDLIERREENIIDDLLYHSRFEDALTRIEKYSKIIHLFIAKSSDSPNTSHSTNN